MGSPLSSRTALSRTWVPFLEVSGFRTPVRTRRPIDRRTVLPGGSTCGIRLVRARRGLVRCAPRNGTAGRSSRRSGSKTQCICVFLPPVSKTPLPPLHDRAPTVRTRTLSASPADLRCPSVFVAIRKRTESPAVAASSGVESPSPHVDARLFPLVDACSIPMAHVCGPQSQRPRALAARSSARMTLVPLPASLFADAATADLQVRRRRRRGQKDLLPCT